MATLKSKGGAELTPNAINRLADEAEAGYDLDRATRRRRGRPSLGPAGESPKVQIRLDVDLANALRKLAAKENRSLSEIARSALREYVERT